MRTLKQINHLHPTLTALKGFFEPCSTEDVLRWCTEFKPMRFPKPIVEVDENGDYRQVGVLFTFGEPLKNEYAIRVMSNSTDFLIMAVSMETCEVLFSPLPCHALALNGLLFRVYEAITAFDEVGYASEALLQELFGISE